MDLNSQPKDITPGEAELAAGMQGLEVGGASVTAPQTSPAPAVAEAVRWLTEKKREASYELVFPFQMAGVEYRVITARRMTGGEVAALMERMRGEPEKSHRWPMFYINGAPLTDAAWDALDDDDRFALTEIAEDFLPARFKSRSAAPTEAAAS